MGHTRTIRALLEHDPSLALMPSHFGQLPFTYTVMFGQLHAFEVLVRTQPTVMARILAQQYTDGTGYGLAATATHTVGDTRTLRAVLDAGCDVDVRGPVRSPILRIMYTVMDLVAKCSRKSSPVVEAFAYGSRCTALHSAAYYSNVGAVDALVAAGAYIDTRCHARRMTPLMLAALGGHESCCQRLLQVPWTVHMHIRMHMHMHIRMHMYRAHAPCTCTVHMHRAVRTPE